MYNENMRHLYDIGMTYEKALAKLSDDLGIDPETLEELLMEPEGP